MICKEDLRKKILDFANLSPNWDGFGSLPADFMTTKQANRLLDMISVIDEINVRKIKVYLCDEPVGSICIECDFKNKTFEFKVRPDLIIDFTEYNKEIIVSQGGFRLDAEVVGCILNG